MKGNTKRKGGNTSVTGAVVKKVTSIDQLKGKVSILCVLNLFYMLYFNPYTNILYLH